MKKNSTQTTGQMHVTTLPPRNLSSSRQPKADVLTLIRQFARVYTPIPGTTLPGIILN